jgi:hypothetical protein
MIKDLQTALAGKGNYRVGRTYASALKKAAGIRGQRIFDVDVVVLWKKRHPEWSMSRRRPPTLS